MYWKYSPSRGGQDALGHSLGERPDDGVDDSLRRDDVGVAHRLGIRGREDAALSGDDLYRTIGAGVGGQVRVEHRL